MNRSNIEDIYPLSPMQEGLLFQSLLDHSAAYCVQMTLRVTGDLREDVFRHCWQRLAQRHAILRTAFLHEDVAKPVQVVLKDRSPEITFADWRDRPADEQARRMAEHQAADRARGFNLAKDALMRIAVFHTGPREAQLVWSYHHILLDGWCMGVLQQEFALAYRALAQGAPLQFAPVAPYRDYIRWLGKQNQDTARSYWKMYLAGYETQASLPRLSAPGPDEFRQHTLELDEALTTQLNALAARMGVTLNTVLQCAWGLVLARQNNVSEVVFGTIVSGRPATLPGVEKMLGLFINAVPVRLQVSEEQTVSAWLQAAQQVALASEAHHYLPLAETQAQSTLGRDLFDHMLIFENYPTAPATTPTTDELVFEGLQVHDRTHYAFDLTIAPGRTIPIAFGYNAGLYAPDQIERVAAQLHCALKSIVAAPEHSVGQVDSLPPEERTVLLQTFNTTAMPLPEALTFLDLFAEQVARVPDAVAVIAGEAQLTYTQLNARADEIARALLAAGLTSEARVGICVTRSLDMIAAVLGVLKAGGVYVPLDPEYPVARLNFMLADSEARFLLTQTAVREKLPEFAGKILDLDTLAAPPASLPTIGPRQLAYLIYTSGSTGQPKGALVDHRNLLNAALGWRTTYHLQDFPVRLLQLASFSFDVFGGDVLRALTHGGQLIICPAEVRLDPPALYALLAQHQITLFEGTPGLVVPLMDYIYEQRLDIGFLRLLIIGSDSLPAANYRQLQERFGAQMRILNSYGVTEATIDSSFYEQPAEVLVGQTTPIGRPLPNTQYYILDRGGRVSPLGAYGELYIGGAGVARGYHRRPELTHERFLPDPFMPGGTLYKTGDVARWLPSGDMEFLGRADDQLKVRGYRIEPGEIETALLRLPGVTSAVIVAHDQQLFAYLVTNTPLVEIRQTLTATLPAHLIPQHFIALEQMPLTPNGKVDRLALRQQARAQATTVAEYEAPRTELEKAVAMIWQDVLAVTRVGLQDNFFTLGGHSLKAMQVIGRLHKQLQRPVLLRDLFEAATLADFAARLSGPTIASTTIPPAPPQPHYALSHAQHRLWLEHQFDKTAAYNMPEAYQLSGELDLPALQRAFATVIERHEALRTAFVMIEAAPRQKILPTLEFAVRVIDLSADPERDARARQIADAEAQTRFDLAAPPLLRATVLKLAAQQQVFLLTVHHIIGDGWSGQVLYQEILALYTAYRRGQPNPLPPLRVQYKDFAVWQNTRGFAREEAYWLTQLAGVPDALTLPYDVPPAAERSFLGSTETRTLPPALTAALRALAQRYNTTLANVVLALFALLLYQFTRQTEVCVGVASANRNHPDLENLLGFFVNLLPVRVQFSEELDFTALLQQVIATMRAALEHQDYPLDLLVEKLNPQRRGNRQPLVNVVYGFQNFSDVRVETGAPTTSVTAPEARSFKFSFDTAKFDLTLFAVDDGEALNFTLEYDSALFKPTTPRKLLAALERFAGQVVG